MIEPGTVLNGTYEIQNQVGAGGGATVFKAYHKNLKKDVAIKKIHENGTYDESIVRREADILKNLHHSYLPQVFDFLILDSGVYTVMDFIPGKSLESMLKENHKFTEKEIVKYGNQLCEALAYLHSQKPAIIHGDIKPANIMITPEDNVCLIDFNISGVTSSDGSAYIYGYSKGYAAPEQYEQYKQIVAAMRNKAMAQAQAPANAAVQAAGASAASGTAKQAADDDATLILNDDSENEDPDATLILQDDDDKTVVSYSGENINRQAALANVNKNMQAQPAKDEDTPGIKVDARSDVYSLGATLYHMLTGKMITQNEGQAVSTGASNGLVMILNKSMETNPAKRYKDAGEMLNAFRNIYKLDSRYKKAEGLRITLQIIFVVLMLAGGLLIYEGFRKVKSDNEKLYDSYISAMQDAEEANDEDAFSEYFDLAVALKPDELSAYFEKAQFYYMTQQYENCVDYISNDIINNYDLDMSLDADDVYYILGMSYMELEDYEDAATAFKNALNNNPGSSSIYVEYAISLARLGKTEKAKESLEQAESLGAADYLVSLTQGEIDNMLGDYDEAMEEFDACIEKSDDEYTTMRAYVMKATACSSKAAAQENSEDAIVLYREGGEILEDAVTSVDSGYEISLLQREAQCYINAFNLSENPEDAHKAIELLKKVLSDGYSDFTLYNNIVVLYQSTQEYDEADSILDEMESKYSSFYSYYMRRAYEEILKQNEILENPAGRTVDYGPYLEYYSKAVELYDASGNSDMEMQQLESLNNDLIAAGLLNQ